MVQFVIMIFKRYNMEFDNCSISIVKCDEISNTIAVKCINDTGHLEEIGEQKVRKMLSQNISLILYKLLSMYFNITKRFSLNNISTCSIFFHTKLFYDKLVSLQSDYLLLHLDQRCIYLHQKFWHLYLCYLYQQKYLALQESYLEQI